MPFTIINGDITKIKTDAVVNAANSALKKGGGVCGAIFDAAGADELQAQCDAIGHCNVGEAVITEGFALPAKFIIHTVGPLWQGGRNGEARLLSLSYQNSLTLAEKHGLTSIAFPLISSGIFGYPKEEARTVAETAIAEFLKKRDMEVFLVLFNR